MREAKECGRKGALRAPTWYGGPNLNAAVSGMLRPANRINSVISDY